MGRSFTQSALLCLLALVPAALAALVHPYRPGWTPPPRQPGEVSLQEVNDWGGAVLWLDARAAKRFERRHVPGALLLNEDEWEKLLPTVVEAWSPECRIVVYCGRESCRPSHEVAARLKKEMQWSEVYVLEGGWDTWLQAHRN